MQHPDARSRSSSRSWRPTHIGTFLAGVVVATAVGEKKVPGIRAALNRRLVNGLITDEATAEAILAAG